MHDYLRRGRAEGERKTNHMEVVTTEFRNMDPWAADRADGWLLSLEDAG